MANLQIKGIDDALYARIKALAVSENRSVSQQILFLVKRYLGSREQLARTKLPAQTLLDLAGSWADNRDADAIIAEIKSARKNSSKFADNPDVFT